MAKPTYTKKQNKSTFAFLSFLDPLTLKKKNKKKPANIPELKAGYSSALERVYARLFLMLR